MNKNYSLYGSHDDKDWVKLTDLPRSFVVIEDLIPYAKYPYFRLVSDTTNEVIIEVTSIKGEADV